jgi:phosphoribosylformylglycinamidine cyclo-ligase
VNAGTWEIPTLFSVLESAGRVPREEMYRVFNMGVGMVVIAPGAHADEIIGSARVAGVVGWVMGDVRPGSGEVVIG